MGGFLVPSHFVKEPTDGATKTLASVFLGFMAALAIFTAATALRQTAHSWSRSRRVSVYIAMIWGQWLANNAYAVVGYLYLMDVLQPSFWLWFGILCCWVLQTQLIVQVMCNRLSLLIEVREAAVRLKWTVAAIATAINISVFVIWIPARLEISNIWIHINSVWDRIEKVLFLCLDASLNIYFLRRVRLDLIDNGLTKYSTVFWFNVGTVVVSISLDVILVGLMSLPNDLVYQSYQALAYGVKLQIEMNLADLIRRVARSSNSSNVTQELRTREFAPAPAKRGHPPSSSTVACAAPTPMEAGHDELETYIHIARAS